MWLVGTRVSGGLGTAGLDDIKAFSNLNNSLIL